jgi:hypothetical protein
MPPEQPAASRGTSFPAATLPIPGNAEFLLYVVALVLAWLVCWIDDELTSGSWMSFFTWATAAYLLSRGIAKASRVYEV